MVAATASQSPMSIIVRSFFSIANKKIHVSRRSACSDRYTPCPGTATVKPSVNRFPAYGLGMRIVLLVMRQP